MSLAPDLFDDAGPRFERFERLFRAQDDLGDLVNQVLDEEGDKIKVRDGPDRPLSVLMGPALGKAMKSFQAVQRLCLLGFGEDALLVLRSNVNLLINLGFILADPEPNERAADLIAYSYSQFAKYLKEAHRANTPPAEPPFEKEELKLRAKRWNGTKIRERAKRVPAFHYTTGYQFYSSIEHCDAMALFAYIGEWDEVGPRILAGPNDSHVEVALQHNFMVMADILYLVCKYYGIERPEVFEKIRNISEQLAS